MTLYGLLASIGWISLGYALMVRGERLVRDYWRQINKEPATPVDTPPIPDDLEAFALQESELHAQESIREVIRDRYADLRDWNLVRRAIGVGAMDE